jgi:hypothetical protein
MIIEHVKYRVRSSFQNLPLHEVLGTFLSHYLTSFKLFLHFFFVYLFLWHVFHVLFFNVIIFCFHMLYVHIFVFFVFFFCYASLV